MDEESGSFGVEGSASYEGIAAEGSFSEEHKRAKKLMQAKSLHVYEAKYEQLFYCARLDATPNHDYGGLVPSVQRRFYSVGNALASGQTAYAHFKVSLFHGKSHYNPITRISVYGRHFSR